MPTLGNVGHELLGSFAGLLSRNHDGCPVGIVCATKVDLRALHALEANPNVGLDVFHDVANVKIPIGVGQGGGDKELALLHELGSGIGLIGDFKALMRAHPQ